MTFRQSVSLVTPKGLGYVRLSTSPARTQPGSDRNLAQRGAGRRRNALNANTAVLPEVAGIANLCLGTSAEPLPKSAVECDGVEPILRGEILPNHCRGPIISAAAGTGHGSGLF